MQTDSQIPTYFASSKTSCRWVANLETASQLAKKRSSSIPVGKKGATALKSGCTGIIFFFWGNSGLGYPACVLCFCLCLSVCCVLFLSGNHYFLQAEENMGGEKKINENANQVDEERNLGASIFSPVRLYRNTLGIG